MTGLAMAYHTNATVYTSKNEETARITQEIIGDNQGMSHPLARRNVKDYKDYKIKEKTSLPPVIESYTDNANCDQLDYRLKGDCAMTITASITNLEESSYPLLWSYVAFYCKTSNVKMCKLETASFPVILQPPTKQ